MRFFESFMATIFERGFRKKITSEAVGRTIEELCEDLLGRHDEVSGSTLSQLILDRYTALDSAEKRLFFEYMMHEFEIDAQTVTDTLKAYQTTRPRENYLAYSEASEPKRQELIRRLNQISVATSQLVSMRNDLLQLLRNNPTLAPLDFDFQHLFFLWFNRGFLVLHPINRSTKL